MMHSQNAHTMSSVRNREKMRDEVLASVGRGFGLPRLGLLPPPRGRLCCRAGLTAPPYSHRWTSHPSTHPHLLLFSGDGRRTSKPSYSRTPLHVETIASLPCLRVVPFLGLAVVHRPGALGAAWSTWSTTDMHLSGLYLERPTAGSTAARKEMPPYYAQNNDSST